MIFGKDMKDLTALDLFSLKTLTLPNGLVITPRCVVRGQCSGCGTQQIGCVDEDYRTVAYFCINENTIVVGKSDKPIKMVRYPDGKSGRKVRAYNV